MSNPSSPWSYHVVSTGRFESTRLITIKRIRNDPTEAFEVLPKWVRSCTLIMPPDFTKGTPDMASLAHITFGRKLLSYRAYPDVVFALLCEVTRLPGITITANSDGKGRTYARIVITAALEDLTTVDRFTWGAGAYDQIKANGIAVNASPENLRADPAWRRGKDARSIVMYHIKRIIRDMEERNTWPAHITSAAYLANLRELLDATDLLKLGIEVELSAEEGR